MAETPELRLLESCSIRYHAPLDYPPLEEERIVSYAQNLRAPHAVVGHLVIDEG